MIGWLQGQIIDKEQPGKLLINVNGVAFEVETSLSTFFKLDKTTTEVSLYIHTMVRPEAILLFGFIDKYEQTLFKTLLKVNGVGPKMALAILGNIEPNELILCIQQQELARLTKLPGIGQKIAERLIVEMKSYIKQLSLPSPAIIKNAQPNNIAVDEAIAVLEALGYKHNEAIKAIYKLNDNKKSCEALIRQALQILAKR